MAEWEMIIKSSVALCWYPNELFSSSHLLVRPPAQATLLWLPQFGKPPAPSSPQCRAWTLCKRFVTGVNVLSRCSKLFCSFSRPISQQADIKTFRADMLGPQGIIPNEFSHSLTFGPAPQLRPNIMLSSTTAFTKHDRINLQGGRPLLPPQVLQQVGVYTGKVPAPRSAHVLPE